MILALLRLCGLRDMITTHAYLSTCRRRAKVDDVGGSDLRASFNQQSVRSVFKISFHAFDFICNIIHLSHLGHALNFICFLFFRITYLLRLKVQPHDEKVNLQ